MTKTCRGVSFNERGRFMFKVFTSDDNSPESRAVFREIVRRESNRYDCRHPGCEFLMDADREASVCGYLKWRTVTPLHGEYIDNWVTLHHQCAYGPPDQSEKETDKICAAADVVEKRLKAWGYCLLYEGLDVGQIGGHGEVGRSSKDKKHCYYLKRSREVR